MDGTESSPLGIAIASLILFGCIYLLQRAHRPLDQPGSPPLLLRAGGLLAGTAGAIWVLLEYVSNPYFAAVMPYCVLVVVLLLGYGFFGLPRPAASGPARPRVSEGSRWEETVAAPKTRRRVEWKTVLGYGVPVLLLAGTPIVYMGYVSLHPRELTVEATYPDRVRVGEEFSVTVDLANPGEHEIRVQEICLAPSTQGETGSILAGARMTQIHPLTGIHDMACSPCAHIADYTVHARETERVTFDFEGVKPGEFSTDIFFYLEDTATAVTSLVITLAPREAEGQYPRSLCEAPEIAGASPPNIR